MKFSDFEDPDYGSMILPVAKEMATGDVVKLDERLDYVAAAKIQATVELVTRPFGHFKVKRCQETKTYWMAKMDDLPVETELEGKIYSLLGKNKEGMTEAVICNRYRAYGATAVSSAIKHMLNSGKIKVSRLTHYATEVLTIN